MDQKKKRFTIHHIMIGILLLMVIISGIGVFRSQQESRRQKEVQESLAQTAPKNALTEPEKAEPEVGTEPESEPETEAETPYVSPIDFETLWKQNPDTIGWLRIPGTRIDYPIVQDENNETYLKTDFNGQASVYGAIYLDADSEPDFSGWNNPIYGHHMKDGSMFKDVVKYKEKDYFKAHQYFEIYTPERTIHLKAVSCYFTDSNGIVRKTKFKSQEAFDAWVKERLEPCEFAELPDVPVDSMFVLVTCSYEIDDARTLLCAVEVDEDGNIIPAGEKAAEDTNPQK